MPRSPESTPGLAPPIVEQREQSVVVVLATFNPEPVTFLRQFRSLQAQTLSDFTCLVVDDASDPNASAMVRRITSSDHRFHFHPADTRLGFYKNFERGIVQAHTLGATYIALSDQDDIWRRDRLARGVDRLRSSKASLVFCDVLVVNRDRQILSPSFYTRRHPTTDSVEDLTMMNSAIGATMTFNANLVPLAVPFPIERYRSFHDHWLARCAQVLDGLVFEPEPAMEYVQHGANVQGFTAANITLRRLLSEVRSYRRRRREGLSPPDGWQLDRDLVQSRSNELAELSERLNALGRQTPDGVRRAQVLHERCLSGSRKELARLFGRWIRDRKLRRRPRREHVEIRYIRALLMQRFDRHRRALA